MYFGYHLVSLTPKVVLYRNNFKVSDPLLCMSPDGNYLGYGFTSVWLIAYQSGTCVPPSQL